jgi:hypothetical protein
MAGWTDVKRAGCLEGEMDLRPADSSEEKWEYTKVERTACLSAVLWEQNLVVTPVDHWADMMAVSKVRLLAASWAGRSADSKAVQTAAL